MSAKFMVNLSLSLKIRISDISRISCAATVIILNLHGDKFFNINFKWHVQSYIKA